VNTCAVDGGVGDIVGKGKKRDINVIYSKRKK